MRFRTIVRMLLHGPMECVRNSVGRNVSFQIRTSSRCALLSLSHFPNFEIGVFCGSLTQALVMRLVSIAANTSEARTFGSNSASPVGYTDKRLLRSPNLFLGKITCFTTA